MLLEKRQSERSDIFLIVEFKQSNNATDYSLGVTNNISIDGFSLDSQRFDFKKGETIVCNLKHSDTRFSVSAVGEIVWRMDSWYNCTAGIKFTEIEENAKNTIAEFITAVKNKLNGSSSSKDSGPLPAQRDQEKYSSQAIAGDNVIPLKAVQVADKMIPGSDNKSKTVAACESCTAADEIMNNGECKEVEAAEVKNLPSNEKDYIHHDKVRPSYNKRAHARDIAGASETRKLIYRLYAPMAVLIIIAVGAVLYVISGDLKERDNNIITPSSNPDFIQNIYNEPDSAPEKEAQTNASADQKIAETAQSQNTLIHENSQESPGQALDVPIRENNIDKSAPSSAVNTALEKPTETEKLPIKGIINNGTRDNPVPKTSVPDIPKERGKDTEPVVVTKVQQASVPVLQHNDTIIHKDTFSDNTNNWDIFDTTMASASIKNGEYLIENKRKKGPHIIFFRYDLPGNSSFVAEATIRPITDLGDYSYGLVVKSPDIHSYGFVFGAKDTFNNYTFQVTGNGFYSISRYKNGSLQELTNGKIKKNLYNQFGTNVLKIVRKDNIVQFYINNIITAEVPDLSFFGNKAGLIVDGELKIAVDNIYTEIQ